MPKLPDLDFVMDDSEEEESQALIACKKNLTTIVSVADQYLKEAQDNLDSGLYKAFTQDFVNAAFILNKVVKMKDVFFSILEGRREEFLRETNMTEEEHDEFIDEFMRTIKPVQSKVVVPSSLNNKVEERSTKTTSKPEGQKSDIDIDDIVSW